METTVPRAGSVVRNTMYLSGALVVQKLISFVYFTLIARITGFEVTGEYSFALAFAGLFSLIADFGYAPVLIREIARKPEDTRRILGATLVTKLVLLPLAFAVMLIVFFRADAYVGILGIDRLELSLVVVAGVIMLLDSITTTLYGVMRGFQRLEYEALGSVLNKVLVVSVGLFGMWLGLGTLFLLLAILLGSVFNIMYAIWQLRARFGYWPSFSTDTQTLVRLFRYALPFALTAFFVNVYANFDTIYLRIMGGTGPTGWYNVAYKLTFALQFIPAAFAASLFPAMSQYYVSAREKLAALFENSMYYLMLIVIPLAAGLYVLADVLIPFIYKEGFSASVLPFRILMGALPVVFLNYPVGYILNACNKQGVNSINQGVATLVNVLMNLALIPAMTFNGAAYATLVSSWVLFLMGLFWVRTVTPYSSRVLWIGFAKVITATGAMALAMYLLKNTMLSAANSLSEFIGITTRLGVLASGGGYLIGMSCVGVVVYLGVIIGLGGIRKSDIAHLGAMVRRKLGQVL